MKKQQHIALETIKTHVTKETLLTIVRGVISDVKNGVHGDNETIFMNVSIGQMKQIPNWEHNAEILRHIVAAATGRVTRMILMQSGIDVDDRSPKTIEFLIRALKSTDAVEAATVRALLN